MKKLAEDTQKAVDDLRECIQAVVDEQSEYQEKLDNLSNPDTKRGEALLAKIDALSFVNDIDADAIQSFADAVYTIATEGMPSE